MENITISVSEYGELIKAKAEADYFKKFLTDKLERYSVVEHKEIEMLESMGLIRRVCRGSGS